jgi:predicted GTPase
MGATGSGKSTVGYDIACITPRHSLTTSQFINLVSRSNLPVVERLSSCTTEVTESSPFELDGHTVGFLDTPGFDDTEGSDVRVFLRTTEFLANQ